MVFHVSTLLPHNPDDCLHLGKKRHIGNDVVAIIFQVICIRGGEQLYHFNLHQQISNLYVQHSFGHPPILNSFCTFLFNQEEEVAFHPDMIKSNLLHAFLVVRPTPSGGYKMAVVTRSVLRNEFDASFQGGCTRIWASNLRGQSSRCKQAPQVGDKCKTKIQF